MKKKFILIISLFLLIGAGIGVLNHFYSLDYIYRSFIKREFAINPKAEVMPDQEYQIRVWYYPFYQSNNDFQDKEDQYFQKVVKTLHTKYPNITLRIKKLEFASGSEELLKAIENDNPPDIYINFTNDSLIDEKWQVPVEAYITKEEQKNLYTVDWDQIKENQHLWGWPFLVKQQLWLANDGNLISNNKNTNFFDQILNIGEETLLLNFQDLTLLRQLLSLKGINKINIIDGKLDQNSELALKQIFEWLHNLQTEQKFALSTIDMDNNFLKGFYQRRAIIGPVNPWLERILVKRKPDLVKINLDNLIQVYTLNIFQQRPYMGDDHTRAAMEVCRTMVENTKQITQQLPLQPAYNVGDNTSVQKILELGTKEKKFWKSKIVPAWIEFWKKGLSPSEAMARIN